MIKKNIRSEVLMKSETLRTRRLTCFIIAKQQKLETLEELIQATGFSKNRIWLAFNGYLGEYQELIALLNENRLIRKKRILLDKKRKELEEKEANKQKEAKSRETIQIEKA